MAETAENLETEIEESEVLASKLNSGVRKLNNTLVFIIINIIIIIRQIQHLH